MGTQTQTRFGPPVGRQEGGRRGDVVVSERCSSEAPLQTASVGKWGSGVSGIRALRLSWSADRAVNASEIDEINSC
jgi:hypothetical protein